MEIEEPKSLEAILAFHAKELKWIYNIAINDAIAAIDKLWDDVIAPSSLHIKIENELDKLKKK